MAHSARHLSAVRGWVVAIGASAGGVEALRDLVAALPGDFPAPIVVVLHVPPHGTSALAHILDRSGPLLAEDARDGEALLPGHIYVGSPDAHLLVRDGTVRLARGPTESGHRPAVDPLFRSLAASHGASSIGVVLSGALDDGTVGLAAIKRVGGRTAVQDPEQAAYPSMPLTAAKHVAVDLVAGAVDLARFLDRIVREDPPRTMRLDPQDDPAEAPHDPTDVPSAARVSRFTCPDCHGSLWEYDDEGVVRFRCRTGHGWSTAALLDEQGAVLENALYAALRVLGERIDLAERMLHSAEQRGHGHAVKLILRQLDELRGDAATISGVLERDDRLPHSVDAPTSATLESDLAPEAEARRA